VILLQKLEQKSAELLILVSSVYKALTSRILSTKKTVCLTMRSSMFFGKVDFCFIPWSDDI